MEEAHVNHEEDGTGAEGGSESEIDVELDPILHVPVIDNDEEDDGGGDVDEGKEENDDGGDNEMEDVEGSTDMANNGIKIRINQDDTFDFFHLADEYSEPLFPHLSADSYCTPSHELQTAYGFQLSAFEKYEQARREREEHHFIMEEKLARLHNLLRESEERVDKAKREIREANLSIYALEANEVAEYIDDGSDDMRQFNMWISKLKEFVKKHKGLPPTLEQLNEENGEDIDEEVKLLSQWIQNQRDSLENNIGETPPCNLASLESAGVALPLRDDDYWYRNLQQFKSYRKDYVSSLNTLQNLHSEQAKSVSNQFVNFYSGDVMQSLMEFSNDPNIQNLQKWCIEQQEQYEQTKLNEEKFNALVRAGFQFDVIYDDDTWDEYVEEVLRFKNKFGHVFIPSKGYPLENSNKMRVFAGSIRDLQTRLQGSQLQEFVSKLRTLVGRNALSPRRVARIKELGLYKDVGGRVYKHHMAFARAGRLKRGEKVRVILKSRISLDALRNGKAALEMEKGKSGGKRSSVGTSMDNWREKLQRLIKFWKEHDRIPANEQYKLRNWVHSNIRKLRAKTIAAEKLQWIVKEPGLYEFLLLPENLEAAGAVSYVDANNNDKEDKDANVGYNDEDANDEGDYADDGSVNETENQPEDLEAMPLPTLGLEDDSGFV